VGRREGQRSGRSYCKKKGDLIIGLLLLGRQKLSAFWVWHLEGKKENHSNIRDEIKRTDSGEW